MKEVHVIEKPQSFCLLDDWTRRTYLLTPCNNKDFVDVRIEVAEPEGTDELLFKATFEKSFYALSLKGRLKLIKKTIKLYRALA